MINDFKSLFNKSSTIFKNDLVVGLSGGPDSIFLLYYIKSLKEQYGYLGSVFPIIVDHGLRIESNKEALKTKKIAAKLGFDSKIIKIKDRFSSGNLQNWARIRRRDILYHVAQKHSADIVLAHQYDDQIETIYMRLMKSSGFDGLIGIKEVTKWKEVKVLRPLLKIKKIEILNFLASKKIPYVTDKSNFDCKFERVKSRKTIKLLKNKEFCNFEKKLDKLSTISMRLIKSLNKFEHTWNNENVIYYPHGSISVDFENFFLLFKKNVFFSAYLFGKLIKNVGGNDFLPRKLNLIKKLRDLCDGNLNKFTINNVVIFKKLKCINLIRENRNIQYGLEIFKNKILFFDNRFLILSNFNGKLAFNNDQSDVLDDFGNNELMSKSYGYISSTIPNLKTLEGKTIRPYLYMIDNENVNNKLKMKSNYDLIFIKGKI